MKALILFASLITSLSLSAQNIYKTPNGKIKFFSDALLEDIEATTTKATAVLNISTGEVAVLIPIKSFVFDKSLMREHFNENYLESDKYPDATFKGKIVEKFLQSPGESTLVNASGELFIHGVSQHRDVQIALKFNVNGSIHATGKFNIKVADHRVKIPTLVFQNIAEVVEVSLDFMLQQTTKP